MATRTTAPTSAGHDPRDPLKTVQSSASGKVKVAVTDIDGVMRGKYLHKDKFMSAVDGGFGQRAEAIHDAGTGGTGCVVGMDGIGVAELHVHKAEWHGHSQVDS